MCVCVCVSFVCVDTCINLIGSVVKYCALLLRWRISFSNGTGARMQSAGESLHVLFFGCRVDLTLHDAGNSWPHRICVTCCMTASKLLPLKLTNTFTLFFYGAQTFVCIDSFNEVFISSLCF